MLSGRTLLVGPVYSATLVLELSFRGRLGAVLSFEVLSLRPASWLEPSSNS